MNWNIKAALQWTADALKAKGALSPRLDAELMLARVLAMDRVGLYVHHDRPLDAAEREQYRAWVQRRLRGEPVQYILGDQEFWSLPFEVSRDVLIPRPETEVLVEEAVAWAKGRAGADPLRIVDVGTGSGAIAIALLHELDGARALAIDLSAAALEVARRNAALNGVQDRIAFVRGRGLEPLLASGKRVDLLVSNPPYIPTADCEALMVEVRDHEPRLALDGGADGGDVLRALAEGADAAIDAAGGAVFFEVGDAPQGRAVEGQLGAIPRCQRAFTREDYAGRLRVVGAILGPEGAADRLPRADAPGV